MRRDSDRKCCRRAHRECRWRRDPVRPRRGAEVPQITRHREHRTCVEDSNNLAALWTTILQTPTAQNPFGTGGAKFGCIDLGGTLAPFGPARTASGRARSKPGTKIFVAAHSVECSTFPGDEPSNPGTTEAQLRKCAGKNDLQVAPTVTVDDKSVPVTEVETSLLNITLPDGQHFRAASGDDRSVRGARLGHAPTPADARDAYDRHRHRPNIHHHDHDRRSARPVACGAALAIPK